MSLQAKTLHASPLERLWASVPRFLTYLILIFVAATSLFPLYWLFNTALTPAKSTRPQSS